MKRVGIITMHRPINPGCQLQAYGLQAAIARAGHRAEIIDYLYPNAFHGTPSLRQRIGKAAIKRVKRALGRGAFELAEQRYDVFIRQRLNLSRSSYASPVELRADPPAYDLYLVGSDQVWNPKFMRGDPSFFGDFAPPGKPVAAFASSFGVTDIPAEYREGYGRYLSRFAAIGVRELSGVELVKRLAGRDDARLVVDPTLLLSAEEWRAMIPPRPPREPYILCYGGPHPNRANEAIARAIQARTGWRILHFSGRPWQIGGPRLEYILDAGPLEFLGLIADASFVVTNSFHGTVFSCIFERPFLSVYANEEGGARQLNLLRCVGLEERASQAGRESVHAEALTLSFELIRPRLSSIIGSSLQFLSDTMALADR